MEIGVESPAVTDNLVLQISKRISNIFFLPNGQERKKETLYTVGDTYHLNVVLDREECKNYMT